MEELTLTKLNQDHQMFQRLHQERLIVKAVLIQYSVIG